MLSWRHVSEDHCHSAHHAGIARSELSSVLYGVTRTFTEYSRALIALVSQCERQFPTFLCTNTWPTPRPRAASGGTRESEHPSHRYCGFCEDSQAAK
jgi:hypothetical protein